MSGRKTSSRTWRQLSSEPARFGRRELSHDRSRRQLDDIGLDKLLVFLLVFLAGRRFKPIRFEDVAQLSRDGDVGDHDPDFAALIELGTAQALAADERARAVANDRPRVQPQRLERPNANRIA